MLAISDNQNQQKAMRILSIFERLNKGHIISKQQEAERFGVNTKTIQRDLEDLRLYLTDTNGGEVSQYIVFNHKANGYVLQRESRNWLSNKEILAVSKVLLESRAFSKEEMEELLEKIVHQCAPRESKQIQEIIRNEWFHYIPLQHRQPLLEKLWDLSQSVREQKLISMEYQRVPPAGLVQRVVEPLGIIFAEYYFYLIAAIHGMNYEFPAIYRLDRIKDYKVLDQHFHIPYKDRFEEGEFRKRVQFMKAGKLLNIKFRFWGESIEAVLDRLPTARIVDQPNNGYIVEAEVYGKGIIMWLLSQREFLEVISPREFRDEIACISGKIMQMYEVCVDSKR